jgi:hypothetical protein
MLVVFPASIDLYAPATSSTVTVACEAGSRQPRNCLDRTKQGE